MSPFLAALRAFLILAKQGVHLNLVERRKTLMRVIDDIGTSGANKAVEAHERWSPRFNAWCHTLATRLLDIGVAGEALPKALDVALLRQLGGEATTGSLALDLELGRLSPPIESFETSLGQVEAYAHAVELVDEGRLTGLGQAMLAMNEREALRWLFTLELLLTTGAQDPLRVWPRLLERLIKNGDGSVWMWDFNDFDKMYYRFSTTEDEHLERLSGLRLVHIQDSDGSGSYLTVHTASIRLFEQVLKTPDTPFAVLATAMLADRERKVLETFGASLSTHEPQSATVTIRHAQLVTHEVRNRLGPARHALTDLSRLLAEGPEGARPHLERIERALARMFEFVSDQQKIAAIGGPGDEVFDPASAIDAAALAARNGTGAPLDVEVQRPLPPVFGAEGQFVMVLLEVLRNGLRALGEGGRVKLWAQPIGADLHIAIEDNGQGISQGIAPYIFNRGFSTWDGSGLGLALARDTLTAWGGDIRHEPVPTGGARFIITLPGASKR